MACVRVPPRLCPIFNIAGPPGAPTENARGVRRALSAKSGTPAGASGRMLKHVRAKHQASIDEDEQVVLVEGSLALQTIAGDDA
eukprot:7185083-Alexandrium_andersonii.AAC.1